MLPRQYKLRVDNDLQDLKQGIERIDKRFDDVYRLIYEFSKELVRIETELNVMMETLKENARR